MKHAGKFRKARAQRGVVYFLRILIFLMSAIRERLSRVGKRRRNGSVCAIGVVALRIICIEVFLFGLTGG